VSSSCAHKSYSPFTDNGTMTAPVSYIPTQADVEELFEEHISAGVHFTEMTKVEVERKGDGADRLPVLE
jgi:hypothetical protein